MGFHSASAALFLMKELLLGLGPLCLLLHIVPIDIIIYIIYPIDITV